MNTNNYTNNNDEITLEEAISQDKQTVVAHARALVRRARELDELVKIYSALELADRKAKALSSLPGPDRDSWELMIESLLEIAVRNLSRVQTEVS